MCFRNLSTRTIFFFFNHDLPLYYLLSQHLGLVAISTTSLLIYQSVVWLIWLFVKCSDKIIGFWVWLPNTALSRKAIRHVSGREPFQRAKTFHNILMFSLDSAWRFKIITFLCQYPCNRPSFCLIVCWKIICLLGFCTI